MKKSVPLILLLILIINLSIYVSNYSIAYPQNPENSNRDHVYSWVSKLDDLNVTMQFEPKVPIIYHQTKILFQIKNLNSSEYIKNLTSIVTILDNYGGLYKFGKQKIPDGKFFINYIFPNNGENNIILQLYKNDSGFALASFKFQIPNSSFSSIENKSSSNFFSDLFKNLFK